MRKFIISSFITFVFVLLLGTNLQAQEGKIIAGAGLSYATEIDKPGIFISGVYQITPQWEAAADFNYFFPDKDEFGTVETSFRWSAFNINAHYLFYNENKYEAYGIAGLSMLFSHFEIEDSALPAYDQDDSDSDLGLNLGVGGRYAISDNLYGVAEIKYSIVDDGYLQISAGVMYRF